MSVHVLGGWSLKRLFLDGSLSSGLSTITYTNDTYLHVPRPTSLGERERHYEVDSITTYSPMQLSAAGRLLDITRLRQSALSVTSTLQSVNRWRHNEYSCCSNPSRSYTCCQGQTSGLMVRPVRARCHNQCVISRQPSRCALLCLYFWLIISMGNSMHICAGALRVVVSTAAFHARARSSFPSVSASHPLVKLSIVENLRDREVACSASDHQGCHLIHYTILRRFSWSHLACMCTKVA